MTSLPLVFQRHRFAFAVIAACAALAGAADGYRRSFVATEARYRNGLASLVELEDARRTLLAAETTRIALQKERYAAWVALYRAAGGGWSADVPAPGNPS